MVRRCRHGNAKGRRAVNRSLLRARDIYLPTGWEPVDTAMAWIAFGSALPRWSWDEYLFIGAADLMTRAEVLHRLDQLSAEPGSLDAFLARAPERPAGNLDDVPPSLRNEVANLASVLQARQTRRGGPVDPERFVRCSAKLLRQRFLRRFQADPRWDRCGRWDDYGRDADIEALAEAERDLLRRIADGKIPAFGWPGGPALQHWDITLPRQRIPPDQCAGPVSFGPDGTLLPCLRSDTPLTAGPLFADILIPADKLLAEWPNPEPTDDEAARETSVPAAKRRGSNPGGRPPTHEWQLFRRELVRLVALDGGDLRRGALIAHMKVWAGRNMTTDPSDRSIEREAADLVPRGGVIPD